VLHRQNEHPQEMKTLEDRWESIVSRLGAESFPDFLRTHWNSRKAFARQSDLFKTIRGKVTDRAAVFELLRSMEEDMDTYLALTQPEGSHWNAPLKNHARLLRMFRVRQPYSLILAAHRVLSVDQFATVLRACVMIALRYNVIGNLPTNDQERAYYAAAQKLQSDDASNAQQVLESLREIYPNDDTFKAVFAEKTVRTTDSRNNRVVSYILCELERQHSGQEHDFESDALSIEHVLPQNPQLGWDAFTDEETEAMVYRIGNMALLTKGANKKIGNEAYAVKRPVLQASGFTLTQKLAEDSADWTPERIAARQLKLAKLATTIWRIDQLS
jgi:Protein of unknown function (DUF1524)